MFCFLKVKDIAIISTYQNPVMQLPIPPSMHINPGTTLHLWSFLTSDTYHIRIYLKLLSPLNMCSDSNIWNKPLYAAKVGVKSVYILLSLDLTCEITPSMLLFELKPQIYYILYDLSGNELGWVTLRSN